jgi:hypothetical protein
LLLPITMTICSQAWNKTILSNRKYEMASSLIYNASTLVYNASTLIHNCNCNKQSNHLIFPLDSSRVLNLHNQSGKSFRLSQHSIRDLGAQGSRAPGWVRVVERHCRATKMKQPKEAFQSSVCTILVTKEATQRNFPV